MACYWGNPLGNVSEGISVPLVYLLEDIRMQSVVAPLGEIPQRGVGNFLNNKYLYESCQYPLITCQIV
jgi:hypothetical protein